MTYYIPTVFFSSYTIEDISIRWCGKHGVVGMVPVYNNIDDLQQKHPNSEYIKIEVMIKEDDDRQEAESEEEGEDEAAETAESEEIEKEVNENMGQQNQKDGSQAGRKAGGRGRNRTDKCRHPGTKNKR